MLNICIVAYNGMTALDVIGPLDCLRFLPDSTVTLVGTDGPTITTDAGQQLGPVTSIDEVNCADVVVVPGGPGTAAALSSPLVPWLQRIHPTTRWTTSVCSGSLLLGAAGLLDGVPATSHFAVADHLPRFGATISDERCVVVPERHLMTAAGVSAGIDMALTLVEDLSDVTTALAIQLVTEYAPQPPHEGGRLSTASADVVARAIELGQPQGAIPAGWSPVEVS